MKLILMMVTLNMPNGMPVDIGCRIGRMDAMVTTMKYGKTKVNKKTDEKQFVERHIKILRAIQKLDTIKNKTTYIF
jgi:hypothetical protein